MTIQYLANLAAESGGILYVMIFLLLATLTVIVERSWYLNRLIRSGQGLTDKIASLSHLNREVLLQEVERIGDLPQAKLLVVPLRHPKVTDHQRLADLLEEAILCEVPSIDKSLWILDTVITLAPLLGLLGTIIGMFNSFHALGNADPASAQVTSGVAEALIATACGLFIAIVGLVFFNGMNIRVRLIVHQMETLKYMLINRLSPAEEVANDNGRPAPLMHLARK